MLTELDISEFRGISGLILNKINRVTLLTGDNDTGKSSVLEAAFWLHCLHDPRGFFVVQSLRAENVDLNAVGEDLCPAASTDRQVAVSGKIDGTLASHQARFDKSDGVIGMTKRLNGAAGSFLVRATMKTVASYGDNNGEGELSLGEERFLWRPPGVSMPAGAEFISFGRVRPHDTEAFSAIRRAGLDEALVSLLREVDPRVNRIELLKWANEPVLHLTTDDLPRPMPVHTFGQGLQHALRIALSIVGKSGQLVLIDEIENGIHYSRLPGLWRALFGLATKTNTQIIATTHSAECVEAAYAADIEQLNPMLQLIRLERDGSKVRAVHYERDALSGAMTLQLPVR